MASFFWIGLFLFGTQIGKACSVNNPSILRVTSTIAESDIAQWPTRAVIGQQAAEPIRRSVKKLRPDTDITSVVIAVGPLLDGPDKVVVERVSCENNVATIRVLYTKVRAQGMPLRRNIQIRPVIVVPLDEVPRGGRLEFHWYAVKSLASKIVAEDPTILQVISR